MIFFPILTRELVLRARSPQMHWTRFIFAMLGVLSCLQFFLLWQGMNLVQIGGYAFQTLSWMSFLIAIAGFLLTADSLSSERRNGTLGLLLLTRIGIPQVISGKLVSAGFGALLGLLAFAPILMLPVLAGGVRGSQAVLVALSLPGLLFFSLSIGLWTSSRETRTSRSLVRAGIRVAVVMGLPLVLGQLTTASGAAEVGNWVRGLSPGDAFLRGTSLTPFAQSDYGMSVAMGFGLGGVALLLSAQNIRRNWRNENEPVDSIGSQEMANRKPVGDQPPIRWLLLRSKAQSKTIWMGVVLLLLPIAANLIVSRSGLSNVGILSALNLVMTFGAGFAFSYAGARFFLEGRRTGSLELLRTTPVGSDWIYVDQWRLLLHRLRAPLALWLAINLLLVWVSWSGIPSATLAWYLPRLVVSYAKTAFDIVAFCTLGMWFGYTKRTTNSALLWPVGLVIGLNLLLSYPIQIGLSLVFQNAGFSSSRGSFLISLVWVIPTLLLIAKQVWLIRWARRRLIHSLSGAATQPVPLGQSLLTEWGRGRAFIRRLRHWTGGGL